MSSVKGNGTDRTDLMDNSNTKKKNKKKDEPMASVGETMSFVWDCGPKIRLTFLLGCLAAVGNGCVYPVLAYVFSNSFSSISAASDGLAEIRRIAYIFMIVGAYALVVAFFQSGLLEVVAYHAARSFRLQWFQALLRQDVAYFDVYDVSGIAATIGPNSKKFRRGLGSKFGEGIQFGTTFVGGIVYAFYSSWQVALVIIGLLPVVSITALAVMNINQTKGSSAAQAYSKAGSVAYSTVSAIKTVLSLNAVKEMIRQYSDATREAYEKSVKLLWKTGFANGSMLGTFILLYCILTLFGTFLIWRDVEETGCDPSNSVDNNETCDQSGSAVFGAMLGVAFAAQGLTQCGNFFATFTEARIACHAALQAMNRKPGSPEEKIYKDSSSDQDDKSSTASDIEEGYDSEHDDKKKLKAILPAYEIDSSSSAGLRPKRIKGAIRFQGVDFHYPTRPDAPILEGFSLDIEAGKTVALVGPSGGGKSTTVALIERFYDPQSGSVSLDGTDIKHINVHYLRSLIGYVGQEPALFATTIRGNIKYGKPDAAQDEIEAAAKMANAHDFIVSFPDGYDTQVGDKGSSLSGGQKQRIAIARILVSKPKILLLDEATSALDSESELVVQEALDNVLSKHKRTTVVIAHRLSTIRNADLIAVVAGGRVVETGTHDELMAKENGAYFRLVESQDRRPSMASRAGSLVSSRSNSYGSDLNELEELGVELSDAGIDLPHFNFKDVTFAYPTRPKRNVLDGFNLSVRRGETIALVGPSGGGKSTTVSLIERFYDVNSGSIEYSGVDIRSLNVHWYRDQIGYVGQEPVLFNGTIAENIAYGAPGATRKEIEQAARQANAHDFISSFPSGYETAVGERGTQLSGGQKQRVAIARALIKQPKILLLDEATSALDSQSEAVVQEALDKLMESRDHTTIVIAHRLSTIRNVDRIAFVADGVVKEYGSHDELLSRHHGRYKRLYEAQTRRVSASHAFGTSLNKRRDGEEEEKPDFDAEIEEAEENAFNMKRAREMARPDAWYMLLGSIGAITAGGVFPAWGIMFGETINLLFRRVPDCEDLTLNGINCDDFNQAVADSMRERSFVLAGYWVVVAVGAVVGNMVTFYGFGKASERLSKRVRDSAFASLVRQEVSFFDKRSVGSITTQLEDDAAKIEAFSGEPIRSLLIALSSLIVGLVVSFIFMWPFALLAVACIPVMGISMSIEMSRFLGTDESEGNGQDELNSPGGIAVETLLNIRTVAALTLEEERYHNYEVALQHDQPHYIRDSFVGGLTAGFSMFVQQWVNALEFWWGGWLLFNYPDVFTFNDFLTSMFALLFSLFGLGAAFQGMSDRKEAEKSAGRIFYLLDRKSEIDPLSEDGTKLDADHYAKIPRPSYYEGNASWKARTENFDLHELFAQKSLRHNVDAPPPERRHTHHHPERRNSDAEVRRHKHKKHKKHVKRRHSTAA